MYILGHRPTISVIGVPVHSVLHLVTHAEGCLGEAVAVSLYDAVEMADHFIVAGKYLHQELKYYRI